MSHTSVYYVQVLNRTLFHSDKTRIKQKAISEESRLVFEFLCQVRAP